MRHWEHPCVLDGDGFDAVWTRDRSDPILLVMGIGFDARACVVLERVLALTSQIGSVV